MAYDDFGLDDFGSDDELGMDEMGAMSERKLARLLRLRSKLVAQLPLVGPARQKAIKTRLMQIDRILAKSGYTAQKQAAATALAASGIEGVGGLSFQAMSPPGIGRLVRLPFYPAVATLNVVTSTSTAATGNTASTTNPVFIEIPVGNSGNAAHILQTPQISWATLRIVGFEIAQKLNCAIQNPGPILLVQDLKIGGGANLFTHEDFADGDIYSADQPEFCGLRDYPILKSPNTAIVTVQMLDDVNGESMTVSCSLLCEVLVDDNYGAHIPGAYARGGSLVRQGGSFVNR